ncbi:DUF5916 domain-containing protein, partial [Roseisolibacter sp. H3M3-2]|uniref:DUF5916 domain-containing protein n=1 Tax=Roseisolibacter sp. H3M3-2 TaxID=3031323 RepID=UPI0023DCD330
KELRPRFVFLRPLGLRLRDAAPATGFVQRRLQHGAREPRGTEARVAWDETALYVALRMPEPTPNGVRAALGRRDYDLPSDWAHVFVDSYGDRRTAFRFSVNPSGVQQDAMLANDAEFNEDRSWNAVWEAATATDPAGWTAEFRIPWSELRFAAPAGGDGPVFGLQLARDVAHRNERHEWAPIPPDATGYVSLFGRLGGLRGLRAPRRLEVTPYLLTRGAPPPAAAGDALRGDASLGADVKLGLTSNLTVTATLLPDFGQVEADPSQLDLSGLEVFFAEQRPFFVEGADIFQVPLFSPNGAFGGQNALFYSRRLGRRPQLPLPDGADDALRPAATRLLGAAKLSGKTAGGWSVGLLDAVGAEERVAVPGAAGARAATLEPRTNYLVARLARDLRGGATALGATLTGATRDLDSLGAATLHRDAWVAGADLRHRFAGNTQQLQLAVAGSVVRGDTAAIGRTQRGLVHLLQRPDAPDGAYDPARTALAGLAVDARLWRLGGGPWRWGVMGQLVTRGFEANDLGFHRVSDQAGAGGWLGYEGMVPHGPLRSWATYANLRRAWTTDGLRRAGEAVLFGRAELQNGWAAFGDVAAGPSMLGVATLRGGPALRQPAWRSASARVAASPRRRVGGQLMGWVRADDAGARGWMVSPTLALRPSTRLEVAVGPRLTRAAEPAQYVGAPTDSAGDARYLVGALRQTTAAVDTRASFTFSRALTVQLWAQPFASVGAYGTLRAVAGPRAAAFAARFADVAVAHVSAAGDGTLGVAGDEARPGYALDAPDFGVRELRANAVMRWEFRPGSALFLVWTQARAANGADGAFDASREASRLLGAPPRNTLLAKVSWWTRL